MTAEVDAERIRDGAIEIALDTGRLLLEGFRGATGARAKGQGGDLVTEYDERAEARLRELGLGGQWTRSEEEAFAGWKAGEFAPRS